MRLVASNDPESPINCRPEPNRQPERMLWYHVLERALRDATSPAPTAASFGERAEALSWFDGGRDREPGTWGWVIESLDLSEEFVTVAKGPPSTKPRRTRSVLRR